MNYLMESNILYRFQYGFYKSLSTSTSLSYLRDKIQTPVCTSFNSSVLTAMILIDLQKAFDTKNHDTLLKKHLLLYFLIIQ